MVRGLLFYGTLKKVRIHIRIGTNGNLFRLFVGAIEDFSFDFGLWN
jgi:hypothetical protein